MSSDQNLESQSVVKRGLFPSTYHAQCDDWLQFGVRKHMTIVHYKWCLSIFRWCRRMISPCRHNHFQTRTTTNSACPNLCTRVVASSHASIETDLRRPDHLVQSTNSLVHDREGNHSCVGFQPSLIVLQFKYCKVSEPIASPSLCR